MFQTVPLSIIRSFSLYTQQWCMSYRFADRGEQDQNGTALILLTNCQQTCVYSEKLLMNDRGTV